MIEAIVLAGGLGTRLRQVIQDTPKPMARIDGRPFLEYLLDYWIKQGVSRFILSVGYRHEVIQAYFGNQFGKAEIDYTIEHKPLGTGGALLAAARHLKTKKSFLVINGDTFFKVSLNDFLNQHRETKADFTLALAAGLSDDRYERFKLDTRGCVQKVQARGMAAGSRWINGGVYLVKPQVFKNFQAAGLKKISFENEVLPVLLQRSQKVFGFKSKGRFLDIGTPASYKAAGKFLKEIA